MQKLEINIFESIIGLWKTWVSKVSKSYGNIQSKMAIFGYIWVGILYSYQTVFFHMWMFARQIYNKREKTLIALCVKGKINPLKK